MDFFLGGEGSLRPANAVVAIIVVDETSYLMQLRDQKPNIFYPGHWGLFGGAIEANEDPTVALKRELEEELRLDISECPYFTNFTFDYGPHGTVFRRFYEVSIPGRALKKLSLHEGSEMRAFLPSGTPEPPPHRSLQLVRRLATRKRLPQGTQKIANRISSISIRRILPVLASGAAIGFADLSDVRP